MFKQVSFWVKAQTGMHNGSHDSWERLVEAVLQREQLREIALDHSWSSSTTSSSSVSTSHYSSSDVDNKAKMVRRNGGHQLYSTEPKMKAATTKLRQQIIQATTYFKKFKLQKKEKYAERETEYMFDKIVFLEGRNLAFDLQDLLSASSIKTLGRGAFGPTFAAKLQNGPTMVVKEFLKVRASVLEFEQQMKILGSIKHDNVVIPRGYHFSNYYKFVLYDYNERKSVSAMLHEDRYFLDRKTRLCIAIGAARGLAHIHTKCGGNLIHGNVKASNIFLNSHGYGCISDLCFAKLISPAGPPFTWIGGYAAPEVIDTGTISQASDVYGFGILLLELLTGKSPKNYRGNGKAEDFVEWVRSILGEGWSFEYDGKNFMRTTMEEFVEILKIGMSCVARVPEHRPKMPDVLKMMEDVEKPNENFDYIPLLGWDTRSTDSGDSFLSKGS